MTGLLTPRYSARTDVGRIRQVNQDYVFAGAVAAGDGAPGLHLLVVADGVGGRERGEWASERAVQVLATQLPTRLADMPPGEALRLSMQAANESVWRAEDTRAAQNAGAAATTLVAVVIDGSHLWWGNVGDSRAYLVSESHVRRLSRDHSWVEEQVRSGSLTPEQARTSRYRNVITRSIGNEREVDVDTGGPLDLRPSDVVLLCSDGLHGLLNDEEIGLVARTYTPVQATELLVELSNQRGGPDNISVIVCGFEELPADRGAASS
jgi:PPM family protein phosphatase